MDSIGEPDFDAAPEIPHETSLALSPTVTPFGRGSHIAPYSKDSSERRQVRASRVAM
jgi:hypothetical protein